jgi:hypothetical protein
MPKIFSNPYAKLRSSPDTPEREEAALHGNASHGGGLRSIINGFSNFRNSHTAGALPAANSSAGHGRSSLRLSRIFKTADLAPPPPSNREEANSEEVRTIAQTIPPTGTEIRAQEQDQLFKNGFKFDGEAVTLEALTTHLNAVYHTNALEALLVSAPQQGLKELWAMVAKDNKVTAALLQEIKFNHLAPWDKCFVINSLQPRPGGLLQGIQFLKHDFEQQIGILSSEVLNSFAPLFVTKGTDISEFFDNIKFANLSLEDRPRILNTQTLAKMGSLMATEEQFVAFLTAIHPKATRRGDYGYLLNTETLKEIEKNPNFSADCFDRPRSDSA